MEAAVVLPGVVEEGAPVGEVGGDEAPPLRLGAEGGVVDDELLAVLEGVSEGEVVGEAPGVGVGRGLVVGELEGLAAFVDLRCGGVLACS